jgi:hypothetical protein
MLFARKTPDWLMTSLVRGGKLSRFFLALGGRGYSNEQ